uniref:Uncharacterized protein n=1 Tax=Anser cygnoides TaxID=8845 RepID=A0A8B9DG71_ANSCY
MGTPWGKSFTLSLISNGREIYTGACCFLNALACAQPFHPSGIPLCPAAPPQMLRGKPAAGMLCPANTVCSPAHGKIS